MIGDQHDLVSEYALGSLSPEDAAQVEAHLETCAACQAELASYSAVIEALAEPGIGEDDAVPAGLAERIGAEVAQTPQDAAPRTTGGGTVTDIATRRRWAPRLLASAAAVAAIAVAWVGAITLADDDSQALADVDRVRTASDVIEAPLGLGEAVAYVSPTEGVAVTGLTPELPEGQQYQMWIVPADGSAPVPGPTMDGGDVSAAWVTALEDAAAVAVSIEPDGGSPTPTEVVSAVEL